jgi:uncharacterized protein (DUF1330 family)
VSVDPTGKDLKHFLADDPGGPVVMLNLLRYKEDGGQAAYEEYARRVQPFLDDIGAAVIYVGDLSTVLVAPSDHDWDAILLIRYPSRQAFSSMVADPNYQKITGMRTESLEEAVLQATIPWPDPMLEALPGEAESSG